ncbi:hypothetical protein LZ32DRAFT_259304 [Colletotrichum eremochloae]|nr:hypothetical protein LZ32DRAFT_259304 [Colletotrichum eremochloae]
MPLRFPVSVGSAIPIQPAEPLVRIPGQNLVSPRTCEGLPMISFQESSEGVGPHTKLHSTIVAFLLPWLSSAGHLSTRVQHTCNRRLGCPELQLPASTRGLWRRNTSSRRSPPRRTVRAISIDALLSLVSHRPKRRQPRGISAPRSITADRRVRTTSV